MENFAMRNLIAILALALVAVTSGAAPRNHLNGDYVEARTASVFAGACHFNGELPTTGRDAEMAWHVTDGSWNGVSITGLNAMAAVTSDANLREAVGRRSVLYVDANATPE